MSNTGAGVIRPVRAEHRFSLSGCSTSNFSKSVNSFGPTVFFTLFSCMWLSIVGIKSQNKSVTPELGTNKLWFNGAGTFRKSKSS